MGAADEEKLRQLAEELSRRLEDLQSQHAAATRAANLEIAGLKAIVALMETTLEVVSTTLSAGSVEDAKRMLDELIHPTELPEERFH